MPYIWKWYYLLVLMLCSQLIWAESRDVFSAPDSTLLFGWYGELRAVTPDHVVAIEPPNRVTTLPAKFVGICSKKGAPGRYLEFISQVETGTDSSRLNLKLVSPF